MFKFPRLKFYRKFLIIGVLSAAVFVVSSGNRVAAACCDVCLANANSCISNCYAQEQDPGQDQCLLACGTYYDNCSRACGHGIPICPPI
jgi:hypothetical protein